MGQGSPGQVLMLEVEAELPGAGVICLLHQPYAAGTFWFSFLIEFT